MPDNAFDELSAELAARGAAGALARLADTLRERKNFRDLFSARQMQVRHGLGLPIVDAGQLRDLAEPLRTKLEDGYVEACREVGLLLLAEGRFREAWMYLQISGDKEAVRKQIAATAPTEDNTNELIEIALYEGVWPMRGLELVLESRGTCNTITTLDGALHTLAREDQSAAAGLLVKHLHAQLLENVRADIARQQGSPPAETTLLGLVADRDWLLAEGNYHIDTSHLSSVVRFARMSDDPETLRLAVDLCEYGRRLHTQFQFNGEEPFADYYPSHRLFLGALLAHATNDSGAEPLAREAIDYFRAKAEAADAGESGTAPLEFYVSLLSRTGRAEEAMKELIRLDPAGGGTTGIAPHLWELAEKSARYDILANVSRDRNDLLGFVAGITAAGQPR